VARRREPTSRAPAIPDRNAGRPRQERSSRRLARRKNILPPREPQVHKASHRSQ
jgi:hypothetical protein